MMRSPWVYTLRGSEVA